MTDTDERMIVGRPNDAVMKEWVMPHALHVAPDSTYKARVTRAKYHPGELGGTSIFRHKGEGVIVGEEAVTTTTSDKLTGPAKYKDGYLDRLMLASLTKLFPDGHDNIVIACAHTTNAVPYVEKIGEILGGKHEIERLDGKTVQYTVRAMIPWDEPAGGLTRFKNRPHAEYNSEDIQVGDRLAVIDVGGKISSLYPVLMLPGNRTQILWEQGKSFPVGIQNVDEQLQLELVSLYPETFQVRNIPLSIRDRHPFALFKEMLII